MAKLAMLDHDGLNTYFKAKAGGNVAALGDLYGPHAPVNAGIGWTVPNNVMLGSPNPGWAKSIDAEYQFRRSTRSPTPATTPRRSATTSPPSARWRCRARRR